MDQPNFNSVFPHQRRMKTSKTFNAFFLCLFYDIKEPQKYEETFIIRVLYSIHTFLWIRNFYNEQWPKNFFISKILLWQTNSEIQGLKLRHVNCLSNFELCVKKFLFQYKLVSLLKSFQSDEIPNWRLSN